MTSRKPGVPLHRIAVRSPAKLLNRESSATFFPLAKDTPALIVLAAGRGSRFGAAPKCVQSVCGLPLARHSIEAFRRSTSPSAPVIGLVHHLKEEVMDLLGEDLIYVHSSDPVGGTAFATMEAFSIPGLEQADPLLILCMGDRVVPDPVFKKLIGMHRCEGHEADLTLLAMRYAAPRQEGKGRIVRNESGRVERIVEQRDIDALPAESASRRMLQAITEANCPLYAIRASTLFRHLENLTCDNAQQQYYLTDIVASIVGGGGSVRTLTLAPSDPEYSLLCRDVTQPRDLAALAGELSSSKRFAPALDLEVANAVEIIRRNRPEGQIASITAQLRDLLDMVRTEKWRFNPDRPVAIGIAGGRLRIAFMHPDMKRFFGPAWQMPIGAADARGREQIVVLTQDAEDDAIHLHPAEEVHREKLASLPAHSECMFPGENITDWSSYEGFGTRMTEHLLMALGYFTDAEISARRAQGLPLPPPALWVSNGMRRPFSLIGNAIASIRTLREGPLGARVQTFLGRQGFQGLRVASSGNLPQGGFSSSSAVTVAVKNAVNALYDLGISPDQLVYLACQAEYGTGVRAGTLDQATSQKGQAGTGTLISSNPRDQYRILGTFPVPSERYPLLFPYSVERDRDSWRWSGGVHAESLAGSRPTSGEIRKMTGKAAEIAAMLLRIPLQEDFFPRMQSDLIKSGELRPATRAWVCEVLSKLPLLIRHDALRLELNEQRPWLEEQLRSTRDCDSASGRHQAEIMLESLLEGWRDPLLKRSTPAGEIVEETGLPLRAVVAYLFGEVCKNFWLIHHPDEWIECVTRSQAGDRCFEFDAETLPDKNSLLREHSWEAGLSGPARLDGWMERANARPVDYNRDLDDETLRHPESLRFHRLRGGNFFRGLALIDFAEAMLKRAFGLTTVAVRVNAAGQGDFFQVHVDSQRASPEEVKTFIRQAFYHRFALAPDPEFVQPHPGGGAIGIRLSRFESLPVLVRRLAPSAREKSCSASESRT